MSPWSIGLSGCTPARQHDARPLTVAAAADLHGAFDAVGEAFAAQTGQQVVFTYAASGELARQVEQGAPVDLFAAANVAYVEELARKGRILPETVQVYAVGRLVLASSRAAGVEVTTLADLRRPRVKQVAIANPEFAPYGAASREALTRAGLWPALQPKLVLAENIRQAFQFVRTGNAEAGLLSATVATDPALTVHPIDPALYAPLRQALGVVAGSPNHRPARAFAHFLTSPPGQRILQQHGFGLPDSPPP